MVELTRARVPTSSAQELYIAPAAKGSESPYPSPSGSVTLAGTSHSWCSQKLEAEDYQVLGLLLVKI